MSGVGSSELIILILIGLIVLGPKRLPQIANQIGSWIGQARRMTRAMRRQLEDELNFDDDFNIKSPKIAPPFAVDEPGPANPARIQKPSLGANATPVPIRVCSFAKTAIFNRNVTSVVYTFYCNGRFAATRTDGPGCSVWPAWPPPPASSGPARSSTGTGSSRSRTATR